MQKYSIFILLWTINAFASHETTKMSKESKESTELLRLYDELGERRCSFFGTWKDLYQQRRQDDVQQGTIQNGDARSCYNHLVCMFDYFQGQITKKKNPNRSQEIASLKQVINGLYDIERIELGDKFEEHLAAHCGYYDTFWPLADLQEKQKEIQDRIYALETVIDLYPNRMEELNKSLENNHKRLLAVQSILLYRLNSNIFQTIQDDTTLKLLQQQQKYLLRAKSYHVILSRLQDHPYLEEIRKYLAQKIDHCNKRNFDAGVRLFNKSSSL